MIDIRKITAWDVESWGSQPLYALQPFRLVNREAWLTSCAVAYWDGEEIATEVLKHPTPEQLVAWLDAVIAAGHYVVCWNAPFDVGWLLAMDIANPELGIRERVFAINWLDALLLYRHMINAPRYRPDGRVSLGLKPAVERFIPIMAGYEDDVTFDPQTEEEWEKLLTYNQRDCRFTLHLTEHFLTHLTREQVRCALIEARAIPFAADAFINGLKINTDKARIIGERMDEQRKLAFVKLKMNHPADIDEKVLASPAKLRKLLFETWGLKPIKWSVETDDPSTDKETLLTLGLDDPRAKLVHQYREGSYLKAKFSTGLIGYDVVDAKGQPKHVVGSVEYNGDGMTRPQFRIFGTYTGRGTYSSKVGKGAAEQPIGCAIHQWKRDAEFREIIEPPEGYDLIELDFAGQEFRWMAVLSGDLTMLSLCDPGEDAHAFMAAKIVNGDYRHIQRMAGEDKAVKQQRYLGKVANLSLQYRTYPKTLMSVAAIQYDVKLTLEEARAIHATYLTTYRGVRAYWKRQIAFARANHYVETLAGRRVHLGHPDTWKWEDEDGTTQDWTWGHESTAINFPIQGIGGDQKYLALLAARNYLPSVDGRFYMELHDGLFFVVPKDKSRRAVHDLKRLLSNLPYKRAWGVDLPIQFPVDAKIGPSWGELKEVA